MISMFLSYKAPYSTIEKKYRDTSFICSKQNTCEQGHVSRITGVWTVFNRI